MDQLATDLRWVTDLLFPKPTTGSDQRTFRVVGGDHLRLLIPNESRLAAARAVVRPGGNGGTIPALRRIAAWCGVSTGLAQRSMRSLTVLSAHEGSTIHEYLAKALGLDEVMLAVALGPPRPNRKPVIQVFDGDCSVVGYAKVGWNPLTSRLVGHEADFLSSVDRSRLSQIVVPTVLHRGSWGGNEIVVSSSLLPPTPVGGRQIGTPGTAAMAEVAGLDQIGAHSLAEGPYWDTLLERVESIADGPAAARARAAVDVLAGRWGSTEVALGRWHGDWAPWNMADAGGRLHVWDWERTAPFRPIGLDAIHFEAQRLARGLPIDHDVVSEAIRRSAGVLTALGHGDAGRSGVFESLYPLELHLRYAESLPEHSENGPVAVPPVPALVTQ